LPKELSEFFGGNEIEIVRLTPNLEPDWSNFINLRDDHSVYHTLAWRNLLTETYGYKPEYLLAVENSEVVGVLPLMLVKGILTGKRLVSLPFSHRVPVLGSDSAQKKLLQTAVDFAHEKGIRLILKTGMPCIENEEFWELIANFNTELDLTQDEGTLWRNAHPKKSRWAARKAQKLGVKIVREKSDENLLSYERMELETRKRQGAPPYPTGYFQNLFKLIENAVIQIALYNDVPIAGNILLKSGNSMIYAYGASIPEGRETGANDLLVWEAIKYSKDEGLRTFDFGSTPIQHRMLLKFKEKWGGKTESLPYYIYPKSGKAGPKRDSFAVKLVSSLLRHIPMIIFKKFGPWLLKEVG